MNYIWKGKSCTITKEYLVDNEGEKIRYGDVVFILNDKIYRTYKKHENGDIECRILEEGD